MVESYFHKITVRACKVRIVHRRPPDPDLVWPLLPARILERRLRVN